MAQYTGSSSGVLKIRRSDLRPGDVILGPAPRDVPFGPVPPDLPLVPVSQDRPLARRPRPRYPRRTSSLDRDEFGGAYDDRRAVARRGQTQLAPYDPYDSEGSVPPRSRRPRRSRTEPNAQRSGGKDNGSSCNSSSDLGSTTDDEKTKKKARLKKWGAIGLASVATIHAVHGVHETMEKRKARQEELATGEISEEEARKKKNKAKLHNAANIGIAAVWVHGAYSEMKEYNEARKEHKEAIERMEERHKKRIERARAIQCGEYHGHHPIKNCDRYLEGASE